MLARGLGARLELLLLPPVLVDRHSLALVHTFSRVPWGTTGRQGGVKNGSLIVFKIESYKEEGHPPAGCPSCIRGIGCGAWIRTKDLRVMSPTSCRCSTPRSELYPCFPGHSLSPRISGSGSGRLSPAELAKGWPAW